MGLALYRCACWWNDSQIGAVIGKGGAIIKEMRTATAASIRVLGKEERPLCALENDELVQVDCHHSYQGAHLLLDYQTMDCCVSPRPCNLAAGKYKI